MKTRPDIDGFLEGADPDKITKTSKRVEAQVHVPQPMVQKNFKIRKDLADKLKMEAVEQSIKTAMRVTEAGIIEQLLEERYGDS